MQATKTTRINSCRGSIEREAEELRQDPESAALTESTQLLPLKDRESVTDQVQPEQKQDPESVSLSKQIDDALGRYYAQMERTDYYGEGGQNADGLFFKWFRDNDAIEQELGQTAYFQECAFTNFTDDFPLNDHAHQFGQEPTNL